MASLLIVRRGGDIIGHCDALCYDAKHTECVCRACGGVNHGVGLERARTEHPEIEFELDESVQHLPLFPLPEE